jgi:hypothetical protein
LAGRASDAAIAKLGQKNDTRTLCANCGLIAMMKENLTLMTAASWTLWHPFKECLNNHALMLFPCYGDFPADIINKTKEAAMKTHIPAQFYLYD